MAFDFKKEYREFYLPKSLPQLVTVPKANYIAVRGAGDPNAQGGAYQQAIGILYAVAYTLKMSPRSGYSMDGYFDYVVPPLEGFWELGGSQPNAADKSAFRWISVLRLPEFVTPQDVAWAVRTASEKKKLDCSAAEFLTVDEGLCVQMLHVGPFDEEPASLARMEEFLRGQGCVSDLSKTRLHHEIYLSDARRVPPEKWRTVLRQPVRKIESRDLLVK